MSYYKFHEDDLFINTVRSEPQYSFYIYSGSVYIDNIPHLSGNVRDTSSENIFGVPNGFISLYEYNIDRPESGTGAGRIYPFVYKDGKRNSFKTISKADYDTQYLPGDIVTSSYNMSSSISRDYIPSANTTNTQRKRIIALKNTLNHYVYMSAHYQYSSSLGNKGTQDINIISIPSIFYGSSIKKGSVKLDFLVSGSLVGRLTDSKKNGELTQVSGANSANDCKVAGVVLYNEGFLILTGSWNISDDTQNYQYGTSPTISDVPKWIYWGAGANDNNSAMFSGNPNSRKNAVCSSFLLEYSGTTTPQTITMLAHAKYNELNHSNNPTFLTASVANKLDIISSQVSGAYQFIEKPTKVKNIVSASYTDTEPPFEKTTYITKVGIYDKHKNLIGIAKLARPIRKTEDVNYTFKIKLDI